ncbi:MAG: hypothetical protein LBL74_04890 [Bacteroidales bacterium]|jgi:hypothetical protein|nr:hypothetical protein [Bacteroidales bacterium]
MEDKNEIRLARVWMWFSEHKDTLMDIDALDEEAAEAVLLEFDEVLKQYSEGIDFELGDLTQKGRTLLLTTGGNADYFEDVFDLCEQAPILDFWEIIPLRQPQGEKAVIRYGKYHYKAKELYFVPLESDNEEDGVGIRVGISNYEQDEEEQYIAVYSLVEAIAGEYECGTMIDYFELCSLPADIKNTDFIPLTDLPEFLLWADGTKD